VNYSDVILLDNKRGSLGIVVYGLILKEKTEPEYDLFVEKAECQTKRHERTFNKVCRSIDGLNDFEEVRAPNGFPEYFLNRKEFNETGWAQGFALPPDTGEFWGEKLRLYYIVFGRRTIILCNGFIKDQRDRRWQESRNIDLRNSVYKYEAVALVLDRLIKRNIIKVDAFNGGLIDCKTGKLIKKINLQNESIETN